MSRAKVAVVVAHPVVDRMVRSAAVTAGFDLIEAASIDELRSFSRDPTIVVMDVDPAEGSSVQAIRFLRAANPEVRCIVLSEGPRGADALEALRAGAWAIVPKRDGLRDISAVLSRVADGERVVPPDLERTVVDELGRLARQARERTSLGATITDREREILVLLAEGFTTQQVGHRLGISSRTVEAHVAKLYRKLAVRTRLQALARAASLGLVQLDR